MVLVVKNMPTNTGDIETWVRSLSREDPLEEGMAIHSSIFARESHGQREAWRATVHGVEQSWTKLST